MSLWVIGGAVVGAWALLSVLAGEHARQTQALARRPRPAPEAADDRHG